MATEDVIPESRRVILLTFECLPSLFGTGCREPGSIGTAYDSLAARASVFENYYLQQAGVIALCNRLKTLHHEGTATDRPPSGFAFLSGKTVADTRDAIPSWIQARIVDGDDSIAPMADGNGPYFFWIHHDTEPNDNHAARFESAIRSAEDLLQTPADSLIITTVNGSAPRSVDDFESILWESRIRVPLWVLSCDLPSARCHSLCGSESLPNLIAHLLQNHDGATELTESSLLCPEPVLKIRRDDVTALRNDEFLYVQRQQSDQQPPEFADSSEYALYAKPEDVWNVNDVSAEYLATLEAFQSMV